MRLPASMRADATASDEADMAQHALACINAFTE
jgi:hypothetical protein